jgi:hypothetical protein
MSRQYFKEPPSEIQDFRAEARRLADQGFAVAPLDRDGRPVAVATSDPNLVDALWAVNPARAIGIDTEKSRLIIIKANGPDADDRLHVLAGARKPYREDEEQERAPELEATFNTIGSKGGGDYFFRGAWPVVDTLHGEGMLAEGVEVISKGGFIACPGEDEEPLSYAAIKPVPRKLAEAAKDAVQERRAAIFAVAKHVLRDNAIKAGEGEGREYVIKGVLAKGDIGAIIGHPGVGKSLIAPYIARRVANGETVFGRRTRKCNVVYVAAEDHAGMTERVEALRKVYGDAPGFMMAAKHISALADQEGDHFKALMEVVRALRPGLIVIDTLAIAFGGIDENTSAGMNTVLSAGRALARHGAAVVFIHHDTKSGGDTARGHGSFDGALDMRLYLTQDETSGVVGGILGKNRNGQSGPGGWRPAFRIGVAELGTDDEGDAITAAYADDVTERIAAKRTEEAADDEHLFLELLDAYTAEGKSVFPKKGRNYAPAAFALDARACGTSAPQFAAAMERLMDKSIVEVGKKGDSRPIMRSEVFAVAA